MHLTPRDCDHLLLHQVMGLAQRRLARGVRLNVPEATALIAGVVLERIRDGDATVAELMAWGRTLLGQAQVLPGVAGLLHEVQVEGTFRDGCKLVTVHEPICREQGDLAAALYGSFLPVPKAELFPAPQPETYAPGQLLPAAGMLTLNKGRPTLSLLVVNTADRPIQVGSHYHFSETNPRLKFDRAKAVGLRLDIPAGSAVRFEPGEEKEVTLVPIAGDRVVRGGNNLIDGPADGVGERVRAAARAGGFADVAEGR